MLTLQDTASSAGQKDTGYSATGTTLLFFFLIYQDCSVQGFNYCNLIFPLITVTSIHSPCIGCLFFIIYNINMFFLQSIENKTRNVLIFILIILALCHFNSGSGCTFIVTQELN